MALQYNLKSSIVIAPAFFLLRIALAIGVLVGFFGGGGLAYEFYD
jgi:hypothetical protein